MCIQTNAYSTYIYGSNMLTYMINQNKNPGYVADIVGMHLNYPTSLFAYALQILECNKVHYILSVVII